MLAKTELRLSGQVGKQCTGDSVILIETVKIDRHGQARDFLSAKIISEEILRESGLEILVVKILGAE